MQLLIFTGGHAFLQTANVTWVDFIISLASMRHVFKQCCISLRFDCKFIDSNAWSEWDTKMAVSLLAYVVAVAFIVVGKSSVYNKYNIGSQTRKRCGTPLCMRCHSVYLLTTCFNEELSVSYMGIK